LRERGAALHEHSERRLTGRLFVGTSGFSYPDWAPRFYPPGTRSGRFLAAYAERLPAVELNATFRRRPTASAIAGWLAATPPDFRFVVKAQRGSAVRALLGSAEESIAWLTEPLPGFGERLGAVLLRVPGEITRGGAATGGSPESSDRALAAVVAAWPRAIPLVVELQDPSWHVDETFATLRGGGAVLCATDLPDADEPTVRRTGPFVYLRLRRDDYDDAGLERWVDRVRPFLDAGDDVYAFFRHDPVGRAGELALAFRERLARPAGS
jgi:uncharacterized protein YecE (DUF72 family)